MAATPKYGKTLTYFNVIKEISWAPQDLQVL